MREKTRCEVDDPISTPTESTQSSSSSPKVRPVLEKKMRPPISSVMRAASRVRHSGAERSEEPGIHNPVRREYGFRVRRCAAPRNDGTSKPLSFLRQQSAIVALVIFRAHPVLGPFLPHALGVFLTQKRILHVIGDRGAAFGNIHCGVVGMFLTGRSRLAAGIVRAEPRGEPERLFGRAEMLVKLARPARR